MLITIDLNEGTFEAQELLKVLTGFKAKTEESEEPEKAVLSTSEEPEEPETTEEPEEPEKAPKKGQKAPKARRNASTLNQEDEQAAEKWLRAFYGSKMPETWNWKAANGKASPNFKPSEVLSFLKLSQKALPGFKACRKALLKWLQSNDWTMPKTSLMWAVRSIFEKQFEWPKGSAKNGKTWQEILENGQK